MYRDSQRSRRVGTKECRAASQRPLSGSDRSPAAGETRSLERERARIVVGLHDLFDRVADAAREYVDLIAERGVALGGIAEGTVQTVARRSKLPEYAVSTGEWTAHVECMRTTLAAFGKNARRAIDEATDLKDADTADLFTEVSRGIDKLLWMVEAHVQK